MTKPNDGQSQDQPVAMKKGSYEFAAVCPAVWRDKEYRKQLTLEQRHIWLHLLTSPTRTHFPGLLRTTIKEIAALVDLSPRKVAAAIEEFKKLGWAEYDAEEELLYLPKALKYNPPDNEKQLIHWVRVWSSFPECSLTKLALNALRYACELSPDLMATIEREVALGPYKDRPKPRKNRSGSKGQQARGTDTVSGTVTPTVAPTSPIPFTTHHSPLTNVEVQLPSAPPAAVAEADEDFGPAPVVQTQPPATVATTQPTTPDRKPRQPKLVLTGEAPSQKPPANPEHAQIVADMGRWLDRYRVWRSDPKATVSFHVFAQAWKARGIDDLLLALDGLRSDEFAKGCAPKALLAESMIAKGVSAARNGKPRATNPYEANLESARALYRQAQANGDWEPPKD
jgi:hypothetical protein